MKTLEEMIAVMQGYKDGKKIECISPLNINTDDEYWEQVEEPKWNWSCCDYRIAEEPKYRAYENTEEMINDFCNRFGVTRTNFGEPFIWIKAKSDGFKYLIKMLGKENVSFCESYTPLSILFREYTYLDGSPIGVKE